MNETSSTNDLITFLTKTCSDITYNESDSNVNIIISNSIDKSELLKFLEELFKIEKELKK